MTSETNTTAGIVAAVKADRKGIKIGESWFSSFNNEVPCKIGDQVKVDYTTTQKGDRTYKNWVKIEVLSSASPLQAFQKEAREDKAATMILSYMHDQVIAQLEYAGANKKEFDFDTSWTQAYKNIMEAYKKIKEEEIKPKKEETKNPDY